MSSGYKKKVLDKFISFMKIESKQTKKTANLGKMPNVRKFSRKNLFSIA